jgi:hypothetical protein
VPNVNEARVNRIGDAIFAELQKITGQPATNTTVTPVVGLPTAEPISRAQVTQIFFHPGGTDPLLVSQGGSRDQASHRWRTHYWAWCACTNPDQAAALRTIWNISADVARVLYAAEQTLMGAPAQAQVWPGEELLHPDLLKAGVIVLGRRIYADFRQDHTDT